MVTVVMVVMASTHLSNNALSRFLWVLLGLLPITAFAASDWKVTSGVGLSERYSDNVALTAGGGQSSFITQVSPHVGMARKGKRGDVKLAYTLNGLLYDHDFSQNSLSHNLDASMQVEPVDGVMKLVGSARVAQQSASQFGPVAAFNNTGFAGGGSGLPSQSGAAGQDAYHTVANRVETRSVSLTPSLHNEFFERSLITDVSLGLSYASSDSGVLASSTSNDLKISLRNGAQPNRLTYSASYQRRIGDSNGATSSVFGKESYNIAYAVHQKARVFLAAGNDGSQGVTSLQGRGGRYLSGGATWSPTRYFSLTGSAGHSGSDPLFSLSGKWSPSRRISIAATAGRRNNAPSYNLSGSWELSELTSLSASAQKNFNNAASGSDAATTGLSSYGSSSYALDFNHRLRRSALSLRYSESIVDASQQLTQSFTSTFYLCPNGAGGFTAEATAVAADCIAPGTEIPVTQLLNQTTLNKTWAGTYNYSLGRSSLAFTLSQNQRQSLGTAAAGGGDKQTRVTASWSLPLSGRTTSTLGSSWSMAEATAQTSDIWSLNWSLAHKISQHVSSSLNARHSEQKTNGPTGNVKENTVSAQLGMTF